MRSPIIILGGMGPQASVSLHSLIIEKSSPYHDGILERYPDIIHASIAVPDFTDSEEAYQEAIGVIRRACEILPIKQAAAIGIACNTAHRMVDQLPLENTAFISMIDAVVAEAKHQGAARVGLLASPQTIRTKLYENVFVAAGIDVVKPDETQITEISRIIHAVIAGENTAEDRTSLTEIAQSLQKNGAEMIVLGCTELPLVGVALDVKSVISSLDILASRMVEQYYVLPME